MRISPLSMLVGGQFFSAFADNMAFFLVAAAVTKYSYPAWYLPGAMGIYFAIYVLVSPWAGCLAERFPKGRMFVIANACKALFFVAIALRLDPMYAYIFFGIGSVLYSPAKYGILPFLCKGEKELIRGNSFVEGSTIIAIILGTVIGSKLSDQGIFLTCVIALALLFVGTILVGMLPRTPTVSGEVFKDSLAHFFEDLKFFMTHRDGGFFSVFGSVIFWMATRVLQTLLFVWVPLVLGLEGNEPVGILTGVSAVGTVCGALLAPRLVSYWQGSRMIGIGLLMGVGILGIGFIDNHILLGIALFFIGFLGGLYLIPLNALNEHVGATRMGAGRAVAVQNFMENLCTGIAVTAYTFAMERDASPQTILWAIGLGLILFLLALWPYRTQETDRDEA